jgi:hypothetical protein
MLSQFHPETVKALIEQSLKGHSCSSHITRLIMYKHLRDKLKDHDGPDKYCLAISHSKSLGQLLGLTRCKYEEANYPEYRVDDLKLDSESFNFCEALTTACRVCATTRQPPPSPTSVK